MAPEATDSERWCVVTGGRGFAARHLVEMLVRYEMFHVRIADLSPAIQLDSQEESGVLGEALRSGRVQYISADLRDKSQVVKGSRGGVSHGSSGFFHQQSPASHSVNVQGTENVIDACVDVGVKRLIYMSSPSVVFDGVHGILNGSESMAYPSKHNESYSATKAEGELLIMKANGNNGLLTCCIRPSSIFGPGDRLLVPSLVAAARAGKSKFVIGDGNNLYDFTYVENVAHAHVCAERALASGGDVSTKAAGQAYFITNMEPIKFWEFMSQLLEGLSYERPSIKIPAFVMMPIAHLVELTYKLLGPYGMKVPQLTPSRVRLLSCSRTFDSTKAKDRLGYAPVVPLQEGIRRTIDSFSHLTAGSQSKSEGPSKASRILGGGKVADTLLWKDLKQTVIAIFILISIYYNFVATGSTIITALSKALLVASVFLFLHGILPEKIFGYTVEKIPASQFYLSKDSSHHLSLSVISSWNTAVKALKSLCQGNDWSFFLKVVFVLLALSFAGAISLHSIFVIGLPIAFIVFLVYENKEQDIDSIVLSFKSFLCEWKFDVYGKLFGSKKHDLSTFSLCPAFVLFFCFEQLVTLV